MRGVLPEACDPVLPVILPRKRCLIGGSWRECSRSPHGYAGRVRPVRETGRLDGIIARAPYLDPAHSVPYSTTQIASSACQYMAHSTTPACSCGE